MSQKAAWFMLHRLRKATAMTDDASGSMDGAVDTVEIYLGGKEKNKHKSKQRGWRRDPVGKAPVAVIRSRSTGKVAVQYFSWISNCSLAKMIRSQVGTGATLFTDAARRCQLLGRDCQHEAVAHSVGEYVREQACTNGIASFCALLKQGCHGIYHYFTWKHLPRYLAEFACRWNMMQMSGAERLDSVRFNGFNEQLAYADMKQ